MVTVAIDATSLLGRPTGVGTAVRGLLRALPEELGIVGFGQTGRGWRQLSAVLPDGVRPARGPMPAAILQRVWAHLDEPPLQWWTGPIDVAHGTNFVVPPARRAARLVTVNDLTPVRFPELCAPVSRRYPDLVRRALRRGATVHTASQFVADEVCDVFAVGPDRVRVVPYGIDPPGPGRGPDGTVLGRSHDGTVRPYVLVLGTVEPRKDVPLLVRAFDRIAAGRPDLELRIAGPEGWAENDLRTAVGSAHHAARIHRMGWVDDPTALLAGATVLAYPSIYEGFGLPPLEAMALGVPVVATAAGAVPEIAGDGADLVAVGDEDGLAAALAMVVDDTGHRARLVAAGHRRAALFTWSTAGRRMAEVYRELAVDGGSRS